MQYKSLTLIAEVCFGIYDGKNLKVVRNQIEGVIAKRPKGKKDCITKIRGLFKNLNLRHFLYDREVKVLYPALDIPQFLSYFN